VTGLVWAFVLYAVASGLLSVIRTSWSLMTVLVLVLFCALWPLGCYLLYVRGGVGF